MHAKTADTASIVRRMAENAEFVSKNTLSKDFGNETRT
jgi:hypothetical protein